MTVRAAETLDPEPAPVLERYVRVVHAPHTAATPDAEEGTMPIHEKTAVRAPETTTTRVGASRLEVERSDIQFFSEGQQHVRISARVHNRGDACSTPTRLQFQSAVFGAFLPWHPLASVEVPPVEPGAAQTVSVVVRRTPAPRLAALPEFSGGGPPRLATATGAADEPPRPPAVTAAELPGGTRASEALINSALPRIGPDSQSSLEGLPGVAVHGDREGQSMRELIARIRRRAARRHSLGSFLWDAVPDPGWLAPDLAEAAGRASSHWMGNINVLVGGCAVERHLARALRMFPGRRNTALFALGGSAGGYVLHVEGEASAWDCEIQAPEARVVVRRGAEFTLEDCDSFGMPLWVGFACSPPPDARRGRADVVVHRVADGARAVVEFDLDASAAGPGCYTV